MKHFFLTIMLMVLAPYCMAQNVKPENCLLIPRNEVLEIRINLNSQLWVTYDKWNGDGDSHYIKEEQLHDLIKAFILNKDKKSNWPSLRPLRFADKELNQQDVKSTCGHLITLLWDPKAPHKTVVRIKAVIYKVYDELRNEYAMVKFSKPYKKLSEREQTFVNTVYPEKVLLGGSPELWGSYTAPPPVHAPAVEEVIEIVH